MRKLLRPIKASKEMYETERQTEEIRIFIMLSFVLPVCMKSRQPRNSRLRTRHSLNKRLLVLQLTFTYVLSPLTD